MGADPVTSPEFGYAVVIVMFGVLLVGALVQTARRRR